MDTPLERFFRKIPPRGEMSQIKFSYKKHVPIGRAFLTRHPRFFFSLLPPKVIAHDEAGVLLAGLTQLKGARDVLRNASRCDMSYA
jgi:hypothetical protein